MRLPQGVRKRLLSGCVETLDAHGDALPDDSVLAQARRTGDLPQVVEGMAGPFLQVLTLGESGRMLSTWKRLEKSSGRERERAQGDLRRLALGAARRMPSGYEEFEGLLDTAEGMLDQAGHGNGNGNGSASKVVHRMGSSKSGPAVSRALGARAGKIFGRKKRNVKMSEETCCGATTVEAESSETCCEPCCSGVVGRGVLSTAKFTGKTLRAVGELVDVTANAIASPLRAHEAALPVRASKKIKVAQKRCETLQKELDKLTVRLGDRLAENAMDGQANPAEETEATDIAYEIEVKKTELAELKDLLESLARIVDLMEESLASEEVPSGEAVVEEAPVGEAPADEPEAKVAEEPEVKAAEKPEAKPAAKKKAKASSEKTDASDEKKEGPAAE